MAVRIHDMEQKTRYTYQYIKHHRAFDCGEFWSGLGTTQLIHEFIRIEWLLA